jgi:hypothetical protein
MFDEITVRWFDSSISKWVAFDINEFLHLPVCHVLDLFARKNIKVEVVQGDRYVVSTEGQYAELFKKRKKVFSFKQLRKDGGDYLESSLGSVGFFGGDLA